jgi:glycosyltransferase involved in cell wall biosynthesis
MNVFFIQKSKESILTSTIITYNHTNSIARCIESMINQKTNYPYEIHIWDDCSTDGTSEICRQYAKKYPDKIRLTIQKENSYLKDYHEIHSYQAIQAIKTKYFCIIDGDDYWCDENKIQIAIDFLEKNTEYIGFVHDTLEIRKQSKESLSYIHDCLGLKNIKNPVDFDANAPFFLTSSRIFRNSGYSEKKIQPIDYLIYYYHLSKGPIYYYDKIMSTYVVSEKSTFASQPTSEIINLNHMFAYKLSLLFDFKEDKFCTELQKNCHNKFLISRIRYKVLLLLKTMFGVKFGWEAWFFIIFVPKYGLRCMDLQYIYNSKKIKKKIDSSI